MDTSTMRITRTAAAVMALAIALTLAAGSSASARTDTPTPTGPCALTKAAGESVQGFSRRLIRCATARWSVPGGAAKAICIAGRESGLVPSASSRSGDYLGLFQHSAKYWPIRYRAWTHTGWHLRTNALNGRTNAIVTIRMVHGIGGWASAGWAVRQC